MQKNLFAYVGEKFEDDTLISFFNLADSNLDILSQYEIENDNEQCTCFCFTGKETFFSDIKAHETGASILQSHMKQKSTAKEKSEKGMIIDDDTENDDNIVYSTSNHKSKSSIFVVLGTAFKEYDSKLEPKKGRLILLEIIVQNEVKPQIKKIDSFLVQGPVSSVVLNQSKGIVFCGVNGSLLVFKLTTANISSSRK